MSFWAFKNLNKTQGEIHLYGEFSECDYSWVDDGQYVVPQKFLEDAETVKDKSEILVKINSVGGSLSVGLAISNWLKAISAKKICIIEGFCCSAATLPAMSCNERQIYSNAIFMIHEAKVGVSNFVGLDDLVKIQGSLEAAQKCLVNTYVEATNLEESKIAEMINKETYLVGQEAVQAGFCHTVIKQNQNAQLTNNGFIIVNSVAHNLEKFKISREIQQKMLNHNTIPNKENNNQKGVKFVDINDFKAQNKELYEQIVNSAKQEERQRFKDIEEISGKISDELVNKAKYTEFLIAEQLAHKALQEDNLSGQAFLNNLYKDSDDSNTKEVGIGSQIDDSEKNKEKSGLLVNFLNKDSRRVR